MSAAYGNDEGETRAFQATQRGDSARRFRQAQRHSRHVRMLRIGIPLALVIGCVVLALMTWFNPLRLLSQLPLTIGDVVVSGTKIKMENPRLSGFTRDSRRYDLTAGAAAQDLARPGVIELEDINATVEMEDHSSMKLTARNGVFDTKTQMLALDQNIVVTSSSGFEGRLQEAMVNVATSNIVSEKPVTLTMPNGTVSSNRFEVTGAGDVIHFEKGVVVNLTPDAVPTPSAASAVTP
jgi:lipopolysaccharide export system protein LptC